MSGGIDGVNDDVLHEILVRLPSLSVLRCRAVCKRWHRIAMDTSFLAAHAGRQPYEMLVESTMYQKLSTIPLNVSPPPDHHGTTLMADSMKRRRFLCDLIQRQEDGTQTRDWGLYTVVHSVDGLLVLKQSYGLYVICNPITRQWTNLPPMVPDPCFTTSYCAFYKHGGHCSSEYRLLCLGIEHQKPGASPCLWEREHFYYILSTASATGIPLPRRLCRAPPTTPNDTLLYDRNPVYYRGTLHWYCQHPESSSTRKMLAFDTASETFRLMSRPPAAAITGDAEIDEESKTLLELDGELCVADMRSHTLLHIWVLQDYNDSDHSWVLRHRLELPPTPPPRTSWFNKVLAVGRGAILIQDPYGYRHVARLLIHNKVHMQISLGDSIANQLLFRESLVQHSFFHESPRCPQLACIAFSHN